MTLYPTITFSGGSRVELTLSIYRRWGDADHETYRYVSVWLSLPYCYGSRAIRYNPMRFGRHTDRHGRTYFYFGLGGCYQDVRPTRRVGQDYKPGTKLLGCEFIWN